MHTLLATPRIPTDTVSAPSPSLPSRSPTLPPRLIPLLTTPTVISASIHPGITGTLLSAQIDAVPTCKAVILSAYGSGNLPINEESAILPALRSAVEKEILIVVISQCESGFQCLCSVLPVHRIDPAA